MIEMEQLDFTELKKACVSLNEVEGLLAKAELENIKTVAVKKDRLVEAFTKAVEAISGVGAEEELPELAINMYNTIYGVEGEGEAEGEEEETLEGEEGEDEVEGDGEDEAPAAAKPKAKAKAKAPAKAAAKPKVEKEKKKKEIKRSPYGHILSAISGKIDVMMSGGTTFGALADELEVNRSRINSHIKALKNKGLTVLVKESENWKKTTVTVKEKSL